MLSMRSLPSMRAPASRSSTSNSTPTALAGLLRPRKRTLESPLPSCSTTRFFLPPSSASRSLAAVDRSPATSLCRTRPTWRSCCARASCLDGSRSSSNARRSTAGLLRSSDARLLHQRAPVRDLGAHELPQLLDRWRVDWKQSHIGNLPHDLGRCHDALDLGVQLADDLRRRCGGRND